MSEFKDLYKSNYSHSKEHSQTKRREQLLEEQRRKREDNFSGHREIKSATKYKRLPRDYDYKYNLMLSEWMMEAPDILEDFMLVPCPKGIRCTLSNEKSRSECKLYYKNGSEFLSIKTNLPRYTVLDCVYTKDGGILFILDVIKYDGRCFMDCDTAFRRYWIKTKFLEDDLRIYEGDNKKNLKLHLIETYDFIDSHLIHNCFQSYPIFDSEKTELDGFLFYHKEALYTVGESPLVLWLFPFMIEDVLPMFRVHEYYNQQKPQNYTNYLDYIYEFNQKLKEKKGKYGSKKKHHEKENMDVQEASDDDGGVDEMQRMIDLERFGEFE